MIAVLADIVGSRQLPDRQAAQYALDETIARVDREGVRARERLRPTVGDEQQGVYDGLSEALAAVLLVQLGLPDGVECRFGLGIGEVGAVTGAAGRVPEGPGWWAAREAIDHVHRLQNRAAPRARTWIVASEGDDVTMGSSIATANAYLLLRDQLVGAMSARERRLTYGRCLGRTQSELAEQEQITQSAVSQALRGAGSAAVTQGILALGVELPLREAGSGA